MVGKNFSASTYFILIPARFYLAAAGLGILVDFESLFEMYIPDESSYFRPEVESDMMKGDMKGKGGDGWMKGGKMGGKGMDMMGGKGMDMMMNDPMGAMSIILSTNLITRSFTPSMNSRTGLAFSLGI